MLIRPVASRRDKTSRVLPFLKQLKYIGNENHHLGFTNPVIKVKCNCLIHSVACFTCPMMIRIWGDSAKFLMIVAILDRELKKKL